MFCRIFLTSKHLKPEKGDIMPKIPKRYLKVEPWKLKETGFHAERALVSESLFSLSNEYMGVRGFFDEGYPGKSLVGTYFNGVYEVPKKMQKSAYRGISARSHYMVNATNAFYTRLSFGDESYVFDLESITDYVRVLDFKTGEMVRSYTYKDLFTISFKRILDMKIYPIMHQQIIIQPLAYRGPVTIEIGLDLSIKHFDKPGFWSVESHEKRELFGRTTTGQTLYVAYDLAVNERFRSIHSYRDRLNTESITLDLQDEIVLGKRVVALIDREGKKELGLLQKEASDLLKHASYEKTLADNRSFYADYWNRNDILIEGDPENQQGIRYCLFQLVNTYQGVSAENNIGAKGLTGEAYSGHAFWDSETYCLPVFLFSNPQAAKNLLMFRHKTLDQARKRAKELDCKGACYPIATLNGHEACDLWQHASLQFQPTSGVAYGIKHYVIHTDDREFLFDYGFEMLVEIARFFSSRGQYNQDRTRFGYYGVMGPDEFQMMVNHNAYTNVLAKKSMETMIEYYRTYRNEPRVIEVVRRLKLDEIEIETMEKQCELMYIPYDKQTKIYEQHEGFFDLPHIDIHAIPEKEFPLYYSWSYDRIYRNDMIKQPDVLMFMFLYNDDYDLDVKKANYDYYEPKTIHESSLSPSIHSILATEIGYHDQALDFFGFATRMDIDDYNNNTHEGLHMTSIAAAWVNIVHGFGGLRSDGDILSLAPMCPKTWTSYRFHLRYFGSNLRVTVTKDQTMIEIDQDLDKPVKVHGTPMLLKKGRTTIHHVGS
jgi:maltose phosphorylase